MTNSSHPEVTAPEIAAERITAGAIPRMLRIMAVASFALLLPIYWFYGWQGTLGMALGAAVSYLNFRTLVSGVEALGDRIVNRQSKERGWLIVLRFLWRYALVGIVAYAIFKGSPVAFRGFLWGLCVPVVALMTEAGFEALMAFRKPTAKG